MELGTDECTIRMAVVIEFLGKCVPLRSNESATWRAKRGHFRDDDPAVDLTRQEAWLIGRRVPERGQDRELLLAQLAALESQGTADMARRPTHRLSTLVEGLFPGLRAQVVR